MADKQVNVRLMIHVIDLNVDKVIFENIIIIIKILDKNTVIQFMQKSSDLCKFKIINDIPNIWFAVCI